MEKLGREKLSESTVRIEPYQSPEFTLNWILSWYKQGLSKSNIDKFNSMTVGEILENWDSDYFRNMTMNMGREMYRNLACGSTLYGKK